MDIYRHLEGRVWKGIASRVIDVLFHLISDIPNSINQQKENVFILPASIVCVSKAYLIHCAIDLHCFLKLLKGNQKQCCANSYVQSLQLRIEKKE